jgi:hypothetical protein
MFHNPLVVIRPPEVVGDITFIHLKIISQSTFLAGEDNETRINNMSLNLFFKNG